MIARSKKVGLMVVSFLFVIAGTSFAQAQGEATIGARLEQPRTQYDIGVGVMLGSFTSINAKVWQNEIDAWDFGVGSNYEADWWVYGDKLWHFSGILTEFNQNLRNVSPYVGIGAGVGFDREIDNEVRDFDLFGRIPLGVAWYPAQMERLGVYAELIPSLSVTPELASYFDAGVGARYYF